MHLSYSKMVFAFMVLGITVFAGYLLAGGERVPGQHAGVVIQFGMEPDVLEGCTVLVDGEPAGTLKRLGNNFRTAFAMESGEHIIEVLHPDYDCEPIEVTTGGALGAVHLIVDFESRRLAGGEEEVYLTMNL